MRRVERHVDRLCFAVTGGSFRALERLRFISGSGSFWPIAAFREEHPRVEFSRSQHADMGYQRHHRVDLLAC